MKFLADACCDALIVRTLRALGYDVLFIAEQSPGVPDDDVLLLSVNSERILLTEDRDFCELVFRDGKPGYGVVLVRIPAEQRLRKADRITTLVKEHRERLPGAMTTLTLAQIRIRPLPGHETEATGEAQPG